MKGDPVAVALAVLGPRAERDVALAPFTTYRLGGPAAVLVRAGGVDDLVAVAAARRESGLPVLVIGRGSNLLVSDRGFCGIAVVATTLGGDLVVAAERAPLGTAGLGTAGRGTAVARAGGAMALPVVARRLAAAGWRGFEWAVGVPGTIGGAVRMNAGGHGSDMAACVVSAEVFDLRAGVLSAWPAATLGLRFRGSDLTDDHVVVTASLRLAAGDPTAAEAELAEIVRWRREHQPGGQNAGSVFVNPVPGEVSAGRLIDDAGLRGLRYGTAVVSAKHANFIQAGEDGSAEDVRRLMELVRAKVAAETGYRLRSEVRLVGFAEEAP